MEGQVFVPYMGIGGMNVSNGWGTPDGMMPLNMSGSTNPGEESAAGTRVNVRWVYPGGFANKAGTTGAPYWGYALHLQTPCSDEDIVNWLTGAVPATRSDVPNHKYSQTEIENGSDDVVQAINYMVSVYVQDVLQSGQYEDFRKYYAGCVFYVL